MARRKSVEGYVNVRDFNNFDVDITVWQFKTDAVHDCLAQEDVVRVRITKLPKTERKGDG